LLLVEPITKPAKIFLGGRFRSRRDFPYIFKKKKKCMEKKFLRQKNFFVAEMSDWTTQKKVKLARLNGASQLFADVLSEAIRLYI